MQPFTGARWKALGVATRLEVLTLDAVPAILGGTHGVEIETGSASPRWGLSVNLRLDADAAARVGTLAEEVSDVAGPGHWLTGSPRSSHLTVRPLEPHRSEVPDDDDALRRYDAALTQACRGIEPVRLALGPVGLARTCVLLGARPLDGSLERLHRRIDASLGADGWFQHGVVRDLWYVTLLHFGRIVEDGQRLVDWAGARRELDLGTVSCSEVQIIHWRLRAGQVDARPLVEVRLGV